MTEMMHLLVGHSDPICGAKRLEPSEGINQYTTKVENTTCKECLNLALAKLGC